MTQVRQLLRRDGERSPGTRPPAAQNPVATLVRAIMAGAVLSLLIACATVIEGAATPPHAWLADYYSSSCDILSGVYVESGDPAPENAHSWLYNIVWPVSGSLVSIIEQGANVNARDKFSSVRLQVDATGQITFEAKDREERLQSLTPRPWVCETGTLVSRVDLRPDLPASSPLRRSESYVRLWKSADGALIAEQTIRAAKAGSSEFRPVARFYFHFSRGVEG